MVYLPGWLKSWNLVTVTWSAKIRLAPISSDTTPVVCRDSVILGAEIGGGRSGTSLHVADVYFVASPILGIWPGEVMKLMLRSEVFVTVTSRRSSVPALMGSFGAAIVKETTV